MFAGCNEVRARGLAPLRRGEPGYGEHMDGDGDGVACEPYVGMEAGSETDVDF
jgi:Excalibur calcium-binding domain